MDRLLTKTEVCDKLGVSRPTLDRIVAAGELDAVRIRRQVRFFEQDVLRYLSRCRSAEQPKPAEQEQKEPARRGRPKGRKTRPQPEQYVPGMRVV